MNDEAHPHGAFAASTAAAPSNTNTAMPAAAAAAAASSSSSSSSSSQHFAQVTFRVRAEKLGYGEDLFLIPMTSSDLATAAAATAGGQHQHHHHRVSSGHQVLTLCISLDLFCTPSNSLILPSPPAHTQTHYSSSSRFHSSPLPNPIHGILPALPFPFPYHHRRRRRRRRNQGIPVLPSTRRC